MATTAELRLRLLQLPRSALLRFLGSALMELTMNGRASYGRPDVAERLMETNEAIHHLSGHLRDLISPDETITESRMDGILEQLRAVPPSALQRALSISVSS
jgi:hypothetical protein